VTLTLIYDLDIQQGSIGCRDTCSCKISSSVSSAVCEHYCVHTGSNKILSDIAENNTIVASMGSNDNSNNNANDNVYGAVVMALPLQEFTRFI